MRRDEDSKNFFQCQHEEKLLSSVSAYQDVFFLFHTACREYMAAKRGCGKTILPLPLWSVPAAAKKMEDASRTIGGLKKPSACVTCSGCEHGKLKNNCATCNGCASGLHVLERGGEET